MEVYNILEVDKHFGTSKKKKIDKQIKMEGVGYWDASKRWIREQRHITHIWIVFI